MAKKRDQTARERLDGCIEQLESWRTAFETDEEQDATSVPTAEAMAEFSADIHAALVAVRDCLPLAEVPPAFRHNQPDRSGGDE